MRGFPGGSVVKNPPASGGDELYPWSEEILHAVIQLSPCTPAAEAVLKSLSSAGEAAVISPGTAARGEPPPASSREQARTAMKTQHSQMYK